MTELTADRTLALRDALANEPNVAFQAVLHALCLGAFYHRPSNSCLEITAKNSGFGVQAPGLAETASAKAIDARHGHWAKQLPEEPADLWAALTALSDDSKTALFAHCASLSVNVVKEPWNRRPEALQHGDQLARAVNLDMAAAGWAPTVENYLGRVPKVRIIEAVREAKGEKSARLIEHLKKTEMAKEAERMLAWLRLVARAAASWAGSTRRQMRRSARSAKSKRCRISSRKTRATARRRPRKNRTPPPPSEFSAGRQNRPALTPYPLPTRSPAIAPGFSIFKEDSMADYFSPTVVQPTIPNADMTALERLLLTHIFESEPDGDGLYFFAETSPNDQIELPIEALRAALASAEGVASETAAFVQGQLKDVGDDEPYVQIDFSGTSYEFIFQEIVKRSSTLNHITIVTSFTCTKMR